MVEDRTNKIAIVTGAAAKRGIGHLVAQRFASAGYDLVLNDLDIDLINELAEALRAGGTAVATVAGDVSDAATALSLAKTAQEEFGGCDALVNNAGITGSIPFLDLTGDIWDRMLRINLKSAFLCTQAVIPMMIAQRSGAIVNISSVAGRSGSSFGSAHYAASKAGMIGLTRSLAAEMGRHNIRVNAVAPASIDTDILKGAVSKDGLSPEQVRAGRISRTPLGRLAGAEEVADAVHFLAGSASSFVTGVVLDVNGGAFIG